MTLSETWLDDSVADLEVTMSYLLFIEIGIVEVVLLLYFSLIKFAIMFIKIFQMSLCG